MKTTLSLLILLFSATAFAHGEDKPGPHGGEVRMPGPFHTEVTLGPKGFEVFLLDMEYKNPTTKDSALTATFTDKTKKHDLKCIPQTTSFLCSAPAGVNFKSGKLDIRATRMKAKASMDASYDMPLEGKH